MFEFLNSSKNLFTFVAPICVLLLECIYWAFLPAFCAAQSMWTVTLGQVLMGSSLPDRCGADRGGCHVSAHVGSQEEATIKQALFLFYLRSGTSNPEVRPNKALNSSKMPRGNVSVISERDWSVPTAQVTAPIPSYLFLATAESPLKRLCNWVYLGFYFYMAFLLSISNSHCFNTFFT